eukprot:11017785-Heterocapsa_arctica.AAC.1
MEYEEAPGGCQALSYSVGPTGVRIRVHVASKVFEVFEGVWRFANGLRASSLSPFYSSQNVDNCSQHLSLRQMFSLKTMLQTCVG